MEHMHLVSRNGSRVVIRQIPVLLLVVTAIFSLPPLTFSFLYILRGIEAEGKLFSLFFGGLMLWLFLEFVATRERIDIDLAAKSLIRRVYGVFKKRQTVIDLRDMEAVGVEVKSDRTGAARRVRRQYVYMYGSGTKHLLNSPAKVYLNHAKLGKLLSEATGIPSRTS